jgi:hypothetical protein
VYRYEMEGLSVCRFTVHSLLHMYECVKAWGPPTHFSQWSPEDWCGSVVRDTRSETLPYVNAMNSTVGKISVNLLAYKSRPVPPEGIPEEAELDSENSDDEREEEQVHVFTPLGKLKKRVLQPNELRALKVFYKTQMGDEVFSEKIGPRIHRNDGQLET